MEITSEDIRMYLITVLFFSITYILIVLRFGKENFWYNLANGITSSIMWAGILIFVFCGIKFAKEYSNPQNPKGAIISLLGGWGILFSIVSLNIIKKDFDMEFSFLKKCEDFLFKKVFKYLFLFAAIIVGVITLYAAYTCRKNILQCILLVICGITFFMAGYFFYNVLDRTYKSKKTIKKIENKRLKPFLVSKIMGIIFILFGILMTLIMFDKFTIKNRKEDSAIVIKTILAEKNRRDEPTTYYPVIKYNIAGKEYIKQITSMSGQYKVGQNVKIIYNEENPNEVKLKISPVWLIFGIIFTAAGIYLIFNKKNQAKIL